MNLKRKLEFRALSSVRIGLFYATHFNLSGDVYVRIFKNRWPLKNKKEFVAEITLYVENDFGSCPYSKSSFNSHSISNLIEQINAYCDEHEVIVIHGVTNELDNLVKLYK